MISRIELGQFKRFSHLDAEVRRLTLFTGLNGAGKSSVFQSLLLARLASAAGSDLIALNGAYGLVLGTAGEVLHANAADNEICVTLTDDGVKEYLFRVDDGDASTLRIAHKPHDVGASGLVGRGVAFTYLSAERYGPRTQLSLSGCDPEDLDLGAHGERVAEVLFAREREQVARHLLHPDDTRIVTMGHQLELWLTDIVRKLRVEVQRDLTFMAASLRFREHEVTAEFVRPTNMGFGVSYVLPIIVAGLVAPPGGLLLVENPEAHLHPVGQSRLARFLSRVAAGGVQVLVESHSDHVINGLRRAVAEDCSITPADVLIQYFGGEGAEPDVSALEVLPTGRLSAWPTGFFDQIEEDLGAIARSRRTS